MNVFFKKLTNKKNSLSPLFLIISCSDNKDNNDTNSENPLNRK